MSSDLFYACNYNNMEEAMRLLSTASYADVNYRHDGVLVDINCININNRTQYYYDDCLLLLLE